MAGGEPLKIQTRTPGQPGTSFRDLMSNAKTLDDDDNTGALGQAGRILGTASKTPLRDRADRLGVQPPEKGRRIQGTIVDDTIYYGPVPNFSEATGALGTRIAQTALEVSEAADDANTIPPSWGRHRIAFGDTLPASYPDLRMKYKRPAPIEQLVLMESPPLPDAVGLSGLQQYIIDYIRRHKEDKPAAQKSPKQAPILKKRILDTDEEIILVQEVGLLPDDTTAMQQLIPWDGVEAATLREEWGYDISGERSYWWEKFQAREPVIDSLISAWGYYQPEDDAEEKPTNENTASQPQGVLVDGVLRYNTGFEDLDRHFQPQRVLSSPSTLLPSAIADILDIAEEIIFTVDSKAIEPIRRKIVIPARRQVVLTALDVVESAKAVASATNRVLSRYVYKHLVNRVIPTDIPLARGIETVVDLNQLAAEEDLWEVSKLRGFGPRGRSPFKIGLQ